MNTVRLDIRVSLIRWITCWIFFQQVFVVNIGGSLKISEVLVGILSLVVVATRRVKIDSVGSFFLFMLFITSPFLSTLIFIFTADPIHYYARFPEALTSLRFDSTAAPYLMLIYFALPWFLLSEICSERFGMLELEKLVKIFVYTGTFVAMYSLYALFGVNILDFPDIVPSAVDYRAFRPNEVFRASGFSNEASVYVLMESWVLIYLIYCRHLFSGQFYVPLFILHFLVLILTFSSMIVAFFAVVTFFLLLRSMSSTKSFCFFIAVLIILTLSIVGVINVLDEEVVGQIYYIGVEKILNFIFPSDHTIDSGAFRSYTSRLGIMLYQDHWFFGVGAGLSPFFLYQYEYLAGIQIFGQTLNHTVPPQNSYIQVMSELGSLGALFFVCFWTYTIFILIRHRGSPLCRASLIGCVLTLVMFNTVFPVYGLYIWLPVAIALSSGLKASQLRHYKDENSRH